MKAGAVGGSVFVEEIAISEHAWVALIAEFGFHLLPQRRLECLMFRLIRDVVEAVGVSLQVEEQFRGQLSEVQLPEVIAAVGTSALEDD